MISIDAVFFIALLILAPFVLHFLQAKLRWLYPYIFLAINVVVYGLSIQNWLQGLVCVLWIVLPFIYVKIFAKKAPLIILLLVGFVYLNQYDWIFASLNIPYLFAFRIFGLSYILFRQIDFILQTDGKANFVKYLNYLLSFYTIISGPIDRFDTFCERFENPLPPLQLETLLATLNRILNGYIKIFILSYYCHKIASDHFAMLQQTFQLVPFMIFAFVNVAYIFFNFSGYCDVVIGFAKIAGIILPENFNKSYLAQDINDFWSRQHITLTKWITDYVFNPFIKFVSTKGVPFNLAMYLSFFVAFLFAGLWHGSTLNYLVYGLLQAIGVCVTQLYLTVLKKKLGSKKAVRLHRSKPSIKIIEIIVTQTYIALSFIFIGYDIIGMLF